MSRRREIPKRQVIPDPKFGSEALAKFINVLMTGGKKSVAEKIVYGALDNIATKTKSDPLEVFSQAMDNLRPMVEVKSRRVGGATYQVPVEVRPARQTALAMRWVTDAARNRWQADRQIFSPASSPSREAGAAIRPIVAAGAGKS